MVTKLTNRQFWDSFYNSRKIRKFSLKRIGVVGNHIVKIFKKKLHYKKYKFLEFGCGGSFWLVFFAQEFGYKVDGIDYSDVGVELAKKRLLLEKIDGKIFKSDFMNLPYSFLKKYDVAASFGVIEHFDKPCEVLKKFREVLKDESILITGVPKLSGFQGFLQKTLNKEIYLKHNVNNMNYYINEHKKAGMEVLLAKEVGFITLSLNLGNKKYLNFVYRVYSKIVNYILKIIPLGIISKLRIGSYFIILSNKKLF